MESRLDQDRGAPGAEADADREQRPFDPAEHDLSGHGSVERPAAK